MREGESEGESHTDLPHRKIPGNAKMVAVDNILWGSEWKAVGC